MQSGKRRQPAERHLPRPASRSALARCVLLPHAGLEAMGAEASEAAGGGWRWLEVLEASEALEERAAEPALRSAELQGRSAELQGRLLGRPERNRCAG
jgi:hypothetical protein